MWLHVNHLKFIDTFQFNANNNFILYELRANAKNVFKSI